MRTTSRKRRRVMNLPEQEMYAVLRAADEIIAQGGRNLLAKILKGSKEKKVLELGLDRTPSYGFFKDLTLEQVMEKVDRMIDTGYLRTELFGKLPMILFTEKGWVLERERRAEEFLQEWNVGIDNGITPISMEYLKDRNRGLILLFLLKIMCTGDKKYIPYLKLWERADYKKVREKINDVIDALYQCESLDEASWEKLKREMAGEFLQRGKEPAFLDCIECGREFVFDDTNPEYYLREVFRLPELCPNCMYKNGLLE